MDFSHVHSIFEFDRTVQVGDLCHGYYKGYWKIVEINRDFFTKDGMWYDHQYFKGEEFYPEYTLELVLDDDMRRPVKKARRHTITAFRVKLLDRAAIKDMYETEVELAGRKFSELSKDAIR